MTEGRIQSEEKKGITVTLGSVIHHEKKLRCTYQKLVTRT